jgi:hypothetical protein
MGRRRALAAGGGVNLDLLDLLAGGTFTRAVATYPQTSASAVVEVGSNARAFEDRGDGYGSHLSIERQWTQQVTDPRGQTTSWSGPTGSGAFAANFAAGPDGANLADRNSATLTGATGKLQTITGLTAGNTHTWSGWGRATSGTSPWQRALLENGGSFLGSHQTETVIETWERESLTRTIGAGITGLIVDPHEGRALGGPGTIATTFDVVTDFHNMVLGRYPLRSSAVSAGVVAPDVLEYADGQWDTRLATERWSCTIYPDWATSELAASESRWILSFGGANDGVRVRNDAGTLRVEALDGGSVVASSVAIGPLPRAAGWRIEVDPATGKITVNGSGGTAVGAFTWPTTGTIRVGGIQGAAAGSGIELDGRISTPRAAAASLPARVAFVGDSLTLGSPASSGTGLGGYRRVIRNRWATDGILGTQVIPVGHLRDANFTWSDHSGVASDTAAMIQTRVNANFGPGLIQPSCWFVLTVNNAGSDVLRDFFIASGGFDLLEAMYLKSHAHIVISTLIACQDATRQARTDAINAALPAIIASFQAAYPAASVTLFDGAAAVGAYSGTNYGDPVHLNNSGYTLFGDALDPVIRTALGLP